MDIHYKSWAGGLKTGVFSLKTREESAAYVMPPPTHPGNPIDHQKGTCSIVIPRIMLTQDVSTSPGPAITTLAATIQSMEASANADSSNSESDNSDLYGTDDEDSDGEYDEGADDEVVYEINSEEIDELMYDPMEFLEGGDY